MTKMMRPQLGGPPLMTMMTWPAGWRTSSDDDDDVAGSMEDLH